MPDFTTTFVYTTTASSDLRTEDLKLFMAESLAVTDAAAAEAAARVLFNAQLTKQATIRAVQSLEHGV